MQWIIVPLATVLLLCNCIDTANSLQCSNGELKSFNSWDCGHMGQKKCYNEYTCLNASSNHTHTCVHSYDYCDLMESDNTANKFCSFEIMNNKRVHGCTASFKNPIPSSYISGITTYQCQIDLSTVPSIKCTCYNRYAAGTVMCAVTAVMKGVRCADKDTSAYMGCYATIPNTMLVNHGTIYDDGTDFVHNLKECEGTFERVSANGKPNPTSLDGGKVWCCTGQGIVCDHVCYNKAMNKYEVCHKDKEKCYYQKGKNVDVFTSGCSDGKKANTVMLDKQKDMMCWLQQVATHYICVNYNNNVNSYDQIPSNVPQLAKDAMKDCAKALHNIDGVPCINLPILPPGDKDIKYVKCAVASDKSMKTGKCDNGNKELVAKQKQLCWKYNLTGAALKNEAKLSARMTICDKCSGLLVNSIQNPEHFWSGCNTNKPNGFVKVNNINEFNPINVADKVEQCGKENMFCWNKNGVSCIWWQQSVEKPQLGCVDNFNKAAGNHIDLDNKCMDKVEYAVDKASGQYIMWQCCNHDTCDNNPLENNMCPKQVTKTFTTEELCSRHSITTQKPKTYKYTERMDDMIQCKDNDPCSQGVKWHGDDKAMLVVDCQSQIPTDVPPKCSDKAISKVAQWPVGTAVDKASVSVSESVRQLAECITNVTCPSVTTSSTEPPATGSTLTTVAGGTEPPQCTAAAGNRKCSTAIRWLAAVLIVAFGRQL